MDTTAHRIIKQARDTLVDGLGLGWIEAAGPTDAGRKHGISASQLDALRTIERELWRLLNDDPAPPECQTCAEPLTQPATGRPRRYCSDACRQADYRSR